MSQLQKRQNHAARVITQWRKYDHITPVLVDLHWLPVKQRIDFKILLLTYNALNGLAPAYIRELLTPYTPARTLRSMDNNLLEPPKCRLEYFGKRSFAAAAPVLWNDLPLHIKQSPSVDIFKSRIKTRLFQLAYFIWLCKCMYVYFMLSIMNRLGLTRSYVTCTFASALVSKGQISIWHICLILKLALYKYHIINIARATLTHWGRDKMAAISQTTFSNAFPWMKICQFRLRFHWTLFLGFESTIFQHWFRWWLGAYQATSHYMNQ